MSARPATEFFKGVWDGMWHWGGGSMPQDGFLFLAQADVFEALRDELEALDRYRPDDPPIIEPTYIYFKTATVFKLAEPGWSVRAYQHTPSKGFTMDLAQAALDGAASGCAKEMPTNAPPPQYPTGLFATRDEALRVKAEIDAAQLQAARAVNSRMLSEPMYRLQRMLDRERQRLTNTRDAHTAAATQLDTELLQLDTLARDLGLQ